MIVSALCETVPSLRAGFRTSAKRSPHREEARTACETVPAPGGSFRTSAKPSPHREEAFARLRNAPRIGRRLSQRRKSLPAARGGFRSFGNASRLDGFDFIHVVAPAGCCLVGIYRRGRHQNLKAVSTVSESILTQRGRRLSQAGDGGQGSAATKC